MLNSPRRTSGGHAGMTAIAMEKPRIGMGAAVVPLMALAVFINYAARGHLAPARPLIKDGVRPAAAPVGPVLLAHGLGSVLWLRPWLAVSRAAPAAHKVRSLGKAPSLLSIVARRDAWGAGLGHFTNNYAFYFLITWLPLYLVKARGFSMS